MKSKQLLLIPAKTNKRYFGGSLLVGKRKTPRPINTKEPIHFVLRSQFAGGRRSFRITKNLKFIESILNKAASKYGIRIYRKAIQSNHIHLIIKVPSKYAYKCFISVISGKIASFMMNYLSFKEFLLHLALDSFSANSADSADSTTVNTSNKNQRGEGYTTPYKGQAFWEYRPFSRLLHWGKDYRQAVSYLLQNTLEALGFTPHKPRKENYAYQKMKALSGARGTPKNKLYYLKACTDT